MNNDRQNVIDRLSEVTALDPDTIDEAIRQVENSEGIDAVSEGLQDLSERLIPSGAGLTRREARKLLVEEMDALTVGANQVRLRNYKKANDLWLTLKTNGLPAGQQPKEPVFIKGYNMRRIDQAVFKARQDGRYGELLAAAGF